MTYYSILDKVAMEYGPMFPAKNDGVAVRQVQDLLSKEKIKNPSEFSLVSLVDVPTELYDANKSGLSENDWILKTTVTPVANVRVVQSDLSAYSEEVKDGE